MEARLLGGRGGGWGGIGVVYAWTGEGLWRVGLAMVDG